MTTENPHDRPRRKKISWACNHCNKAHITCDEARPCLRCIRKGLQDTCEDAPRKRKKYLSDVAGPLIQKSPESQLPHNHLQNLASQLVFGVEWNPQIKPEPEVTPRPRPHAPQATLFGHSNSLPNPIILPKTTPVSILASVVGHTRRGSPSLLARHSYNDDFLTHPQAYKKQGMGPIMKTAPNTNGTNMPNSLFEEKPIENQVGIGSQQVQDFLNDAGDFKQDLRDKEPQSMRMFPIQENNTQPPPLLCQSNTQNHSHGPKITSERPNFLSSAADMEYATLSSILQNSLMGFNANQSFTSNERTSTSVNMPPTPHAYENMPKVSPSSLAASSYDASTYPAHSPRPRDTAFSDSEFQVRQYNSLSEFPPFDARVNQYFLGDTANVQFPEVSEAMETLKQNDSASFHARSSKLSLSFTMGVPQSIMNSRNLLFEDPEEIYMRINKPFSYTPGFHKLIAYLRNRFPREILVKMAESMAVYRPSFIACTNNLRESDLIFMEQCFQRTLLTYDSFIKVSGTPTIVWRRTGEIAYVGDEFTALTGWTQEQLLGGKPTFIVELLDDTSVVEYFQVFSKIAFGDFLGATITECTLLTPKENVKIRAGCSWTLKRDVFGIPMMIIGNFLPIL